MGGFLLIFPGTRLELAHPNRILVPETSVSTIPPSGVRLFTNVEF